MKTVSKTWKRCLKFEWTCSRTRWNQTYFGLSHPRLLFVFFSHVKVFQSSGPLWPNPPSLQQTCQGRLINGEDLVTKQCVEGAQTSEGRCLVGRRLTERLAPASNVRNWRHTCPKVAPALAQQLATCVWRNFFSYFLLGQTILETQQFVEIHQPTIYGVRTKCQMICWHFLLTFLLSFGILSVSIFLAFCLDHLNIIHVFAEIYANTW